MFLLGMIVGIGFYLLTCFYIGERLCAFLGALGFLEYQTFFWILFSFLAVSILIAYMLPPSLPAHILGFLGHHWIAAYVYLLLLILIAGLVRQVSVLFGWLTADFWKNPQTTRWVGILVLLVFFLIFAYGIWNARHIRTTEYHVPLQKKWKDGTMRIVLAADVHFGFVFGYKKAQQIASRINQLEGDLVCFAGDFFNGNLREVYHADQIAAALQKIHPPQGVYGCLGNHDAGSQYEEMRRLIEKMGVRILKDQGVTLPGGAFLAGRTDYLPIGSQGEKRTTLAEVLKEAPQEGPILLLDHEPSELEQDRQAGVDLVMSGHTHGGQFFPVNLVIRRIFPHFRGLAKFGPLYSVVSSGTAVSLPPIRIGSHSELVVIHLEGEKEN